MAFIFLLYASNLENEYPSSANPFKVSFSADKNLLAAACLTVEETDDLGKGLDCIQILQLIK